MRYKNGRFDLKIPNFYRIPANFLSNFGANFVKIGKFRGLKWKITSNFHPFIATTQIMVQKYKIVKSGRSFESGNPLKVNGL